MNNSATITDPNILLDNGVLHIIDRVFNATEPTANATEYDPFASVEPSASATDGTATATDSGAASATDSGAASATDSGAASATTA